MPYYKGFKSVNRILLPFTWFGVLAEKICLKRCKHIFTVSESLAEWLIEKKYTNIAYVVRNCRDTERVKLSRNIRKDAEALDGELICLHLNTIVEESGVENLIRALPEIKNNVKVVLLGYFFPNSYQQKIQNLISEMGVDDRVCILEPVSASELISYITDADLGVITRRILNINMKVSLPNRVFEMVAAGLPMAVCKISDISSTVKRGNVGLVFDEESVCDITNTINTLVKKENLKIYKRNALKNRQKLNWQNESQFLCSVVEHLASEK